MSGIIKEAGNRVRVWIRVSKQEGNDEEEEEGDSADGDDSNKMPLRRR